MYRRIRDLREDSDLTQKSLADYLSCSQVCYSNYETGKRDVPSDVLIRLARFYHTCGLSCGAHGGAGSLP